MSASTSNPKLTHMGFLHMAQFTSRPNSGSVTGSIFKSASLVAPHVWRERDLA